MKTYAVSFRAAAEADLDGLHEFIIFYGGQDFERLLHGLADG